MCANAQKPIQKQTPREKDKKKGKKWAKKGNRRGVECWFFLFLVVCYGLFVGSGGMFVGGRGREGGEGREGRGRGGEGREGKGGGERRKGHLEKEKKRKKEKKKKRRGWYTICKSNRLNTISYVITETGRKTSSDYPEKKRKKQRLVYSTQKQSFKHLTVQYSTL